MTEVAVRQGLKHSTSAALAIAALVFALATAAPAHAGGGLLDDIISNRNGPTEDAIRGILTPAREGAIDLAMPFTVNDRVRQFYDERDFEPVWSGSERATERAQHVKAALEHAGDQGLREADYAAALSMDGNPEPGIPAAQYDIALTTALLRYASDVRIGRLAPYEVYGDVRLPKQHFDAASELTSALKWHSVEHFLEELPPPHAGYRALVTALARYRAVAAQGGWAQVSGKGRALAKRLAAEDPEFADVDVTAALIRFQRRNGLKDDGALGAATLKALNISATARARQIIANMERWRWLPREFERRRVVVNVADQSLDYMRGEESILHSRVIVGRRDAKTPIVMTSVRAVVANPPWNIPSDIAARAYLAQLRRNPSLLATRNITMLNAPPGDPHGTHVNWREVSGPSLQLQQPPGPTNALGKIMLDSPNDFAVYMHDTPAKALFDSDSREKSNGCIRVQEIFPLASLALTGDTEEGMEELQATIATGETTRLPLSDPLRVYVLYWTAVAGPDGVGFRPDRYGRDAVLLAKLNTDAPARKPAGDEVLTQ